MSYSSAQQAALYRDCTNPACTEPVHVRANICKACGGPSPWKIEAIEKALADSRRPYIVTKTFSCMIGVSFREFSEGEVINDPALIAQLRDEECPIRPREDWDQMILCPHCNKTFLAKAEEPDAQFTADTAQKIRRLGLQ